MLKGKKKRKKRKRKEVVTCFINKKKRKRKLLKHSDRNRNIHIFLNPRVTFHCTRKDKVFFLGYTAYVLNLYNSIHTHKERRE